MEYPAVGCLDSSAQQAKCAMHQLTDAFLDLFRGYMAACLDPFPHWRNGGQRQHPKGRSLQARLTLEGSMAMLSSGLPRNCYLGLETPTTQKPWKWFWASVVWPNKASSALAIVCWLSSQVQVASFSPSPKRQSSHDASWDACRWSGDLGHSKKQEAMCAHAP